MIVVSTNILPVCARVRDQHTKLLPVALCPTYLVVYLIFESAIEQRGGGGLSQENHAMVVVVIVLLLCH